MLGRLYHTNKVYHQVRGIIVKMKIDLRKVPVYFINLDAHAEKRERMERLLTKLGFVDIRRFPGADIKTPKLGCATSHNAILQIISSHDGPVLILEDDLSATPLQPLELDIPDDADAVYLGISKYGLYRGTGHLKVSAQKYDERFYRIYNMLGAHAILYLNNDYSKFLTKATNFMMSIEDNQDKSRASTMKFFNIYALNRPMFYQDNYNKTNTNFVLSRYESVVGKELSL